ncbi:MAG: polysaccharide pyruvyl transferase family protein [Acidaminococcaceae bacterium]|nr:polysaccharide pyruvyl transferase family protein [Acidaminococcaceae bacterium]
MSQTASCHETAAKKRIAIITELTLNNLNYGNRIQAFALNYYLRKNHPEFSVETLLLRNKTGREVTSWLYNLERTRKRLSDIFSINYIKRKVARIFSNNDTDKGKKDFSVVKRLKRFNEFVRKYISISNKEYSYKDLSESLFDFYFVGSDVVWYQESGFVYKTKFLGFTPKNPNAKKIAYAASFGENTIPNENVKSIKKFLSDFAMISVRESKSVNLLDGIGVSGVKHVCDPALLLTAEDWDVVSEDVENIEKFKKKKYALIYILGNDKKEKSIKELCVKNGIEPVFIPGDNAGSNEILRDYGINDCSPQEWVWLIKHATYVFTDSFHGLVFSTIYGKPFFVVKRDGERDLNIRLTDYLETIGEQDKLVDIEEIGLFNSFKWDYEKIGKRLERFIKVSKEYVNEALGENNS